MGMFKAFKAVPVTVKDMAPVAKAVMKYFRDQGYEVAGEATNSQRWEIGLHKGGIFQAVIGMRTALKIRIETVGSQTEVEAGIGILESQGIPTTVAMLAFWPVLVTQTWGLVKQMKLDQEAIAIVERELLAAAAASPSPIFCHECGASLPGEAAFCSSCGAQL